MKKMKKSSGLTKYRSLVMVLGGDKREGTNVHIIGFEEGLKDRN